MPDRPAVATLWGTMGRMLQAGLATMLAACATAGGPSALQERAGATAVSPEVLRIQVRALAPRFSGEIEELANDLERSTDEPALRRELTRFKTEAIPAMQAALYRPDPLLALVDAWVLVAQLRARASVIARRDPALAAALRASQEDLDTMDEELAAFWRRITGRADVSDVRERVLAWAREHPIETLAARPSTAGLFAELTPAPGGLVATATSLAETTRDLSAQLTLQTEWLPKLARWQAETLVRDVLLDETLLGGANVPLLMARVGALAERMDEVPALLARERTAVFEGIDTERRALEAFAREERQAVLDALSEERQLALAQAEDVGAALVDRAFDRLETLVLRLVGGTLLGLVLLALLAFAAFTLLRGRTGRRLPRAGGPLPAR